MLLRQALLLEGIVSDAEVSSAFTRLVPGFTGVLERWSRKDPVATWLRLSNDIESSLAGPPLRKPALVAVSKLLAKKRRVWAVEALAGTADSLTVLALDARGAKTWSTTSERGQALERAQKELLGVKGPLEFDLSFDDLLEPLDPWSHHAEVDVAPLSTGVATLVQLAGPLPYDERVPAIVAFVKARRLKATDDRSPRERRLLEKVVALLEQQTGVAGQEPLVLRDKKTGAPTGEALVFGKGFSLWHYATKPAPARSAGPAKPTRGRKVTRRAR